MLCCASACVTLMQSSSLSVLMHACSTCQVIPSWVCDHLLISNEIKCIYHDIYIFLYICMLGLSIKFLWLSFSIFGYSGDFRWCVFFFFFFCEFLQEKYIWARVWRNVLCSFNCEVCFFLCTMLIPFLFMVSWEYYSSHFVHHIFNGLMHAQVCCCISWSSPNFWPGGRWAPSCGYQ